MKKSARIFDIALRVLLSFALVVSFIPIVPSSSFAEEPGVHTAVSADTGADVSGSDSENTVGENDSADEAVTGESVATSSDAANSSTSDSSSIDYVREYAKLMADGNLYECDESGALKQPTEEADAIEPCYVANLIVDSEVTSIRYLQFASCHNLKSVRFEGKTLDSIDDSAFHDCRNLALVDFSGMSIGYLGELAFGTCVSLTSLTLNEPVTIQAMGYGCFSCCGLTTTSLDKIQGLTSLPDGVFSQCYDLIETGLDKTRPFSR